MPLDRSHQDLSIATGISRIRHRTCPHAPPEVSGAQATRAITRTHALPFILAHTCFPSFLYVPSALMMSALMRQQHINPSDPIQSSRLMILRHVLRNGKASNARSFPGSLTPLCLPLAVSILDWKQVKQLGPSWPLGQSISDYYSQTASMWEQLAAADPPLRYAEDIDLFAKYKDHRRFTQFMMGLHEDFEPTRAALLSHSPLPSHDAAVKELIYEENRRHDISECYRKQKDDKRKHHQSCGILPHSHAATDPLTGKLLGTSRKIGHLFKLCNLQIPSNMVSSSAIATTTLSPDLWHSRLGHASLSRLQLLDSQVDLYPDPIRDSAPPPSSLDVPSLALSPVVGSLASNPAPSASSESPTILRCSTRQAMADELDALHKTHTWDMTTLSPSKSAVGCKWVYKIKTRADGSVERYKARLMDAKNAFLNGDLLEEVYMQPPSGYPDSHNQGFTPSPYDSALFIRHTSTGISLILFYVDDMIITGDDTAGICDLQKFLSQHFEMKDLGTLSYFLSLEVTSSSNGYYLSQAKYASDLLFKVGLTDSKTVSTPL
uniref:Reverse transcriptase Ty1/copia-type domain-containing protein n=1 Tax=Fagus sylvatica TaxID=28930 RepID=A0A2N9IB43_FAGSY